MGKKTLEDLLQLRNSFEQI